MTGQAGDGAWCVLKETELLLPRWVALLAQHLSRCRGVLGRILCGKMLSYFTAHSFSVALTCHLCL